MKLKYQCTKCPNEWSTNNGLLLKKSIIRIDNFKDTFKHFKGDRLKLLSLQSLEHMAIVYKQRCAKCFGIGNVGKLYHHEILQAIWESTMEITEYIIQWIVENEL